MERIDLGDDSLPVTIFGKDIDLRKPGMQQVLDHEAKIKECGEDPKKIFEVMKSFVVALGIPEDVAKKMTLDQYMRLTEHLNSAKKN